jgi:peptide/nickel transport system substrate-binding protein
VDLRLLGPLEASLENRPIELGPRKQRAVLAMLALEPGRTVSADRLAQGLWGEEPPASAPKMVQLYVSHLRRLLDGNAARIVTHGRGYELQLSGGGVDAVEAERLVDESRPREALALWHGEPLADLADEPFAGAEIRRLDELRLRASELAIDADLEAGRHAEVLGELDALVAQEPLRERLHGQRMLALYRCGRQADALEAYRAARAALVEQIGVEPGAELRRLQDAILAQDPALDPPPPSAAAPTSAPSRRRSRAVLVAAAALLVTGVTAYGVIRVAQPDGLPGIDENAVGRIDPDSRLITAQYGVGKSPSAIVGGGGSVWIANAADGTVSRVDGEGKPTVSIPVGGSPAALAFGSGSLWVADSDSREVAQIDPGANKVQQRIPVGNAPRALAVAARSLWVASGVDGRVHRIDLERGRVARSVAIGANPTALAAGAGDVWVTSEESGTLTRIDPRTGSVVGSAINVGNGPSAVAVGEGAVWVVNRHDATLSRIDPATMAVSGTVRLRGDPVAVAAGAGAVWVAGGDDGTVARVDPERLGKVERVRAGSSPVALAVTGGSVWTAASAPQAAHRGGTLRVLFPVGERQLVSIDWLGEYGYDWPVSLTSLAYDGLVAYRRVGGAAGATLVGALATRAPAPSRDGRTYQFTLRRGLRFSDGSAVRPEDFRASMERALRLVKNNQPPFFAHIVGARRCKRRPARCDLSAGIVTDARARTITIRLTRPDRELLHKLTMPFAYVVPASTPMRLLGDVAPPGTGPYRIANWDLHRGGVYVRNRHFRSWAPQARPPGFADRIEIGVRSVSAIERHVAAVQRGDADMTIVANPFLSFVEPERLRSLAAGAPGRLHSNPTPTTNWMFLNVRRRPFDDVDVRRAVNLATDRARIVALAGGPEVGQPACQIVPPAFPGFAPYCPHTANPARGGGWTAPDPEAARRLVARSGRAGDRVVVHVPDYLLEFGRYFVGLLDGLGFRASLRIHEADAYFSYIEEPRTRVQIGIVGWGADYVSPASFIEANFACATPADPKPLNGSELCDEQLDGRVDRALAAPPADAGSAWAAADHRVSDLAAAVPLTNRRMVVLVSKRVANVQHHPAWYTLLDQMWVR